MVVSEVGQGQCARDTNILRCYSDFTGAGARQRLVPGLDAYRYIERFWPPRGISKPPRQLARRPGLVSLPGEHE